MQWLVSDAGIALVGGDASARIDLLRDTQRRIARIMGPTDATGASRTLVYYGYDTQGAPFTDTLAANLGTAAN